VLSSGAVPDDDTPLPLPLAAEPTRTGVGNLPKLDPPRLDPSRQPPAPHLAQVEASRQVPLPGLAALPVIDDSATVPVPLMDPDEPAREPTPPPLPPSPASAAAEVWLEDAVTRPSMISDLAETSTGPASGGNPTVPAPPAFAAFSPDVAAARSARRFLILSSATSFVVGLVLGALLFRARGEAPPPAQPREQPAAVVCAPAEAQPDAPP